MSNPEDTPAAVTVGRETLEATPDRVLALLRAIGTRPPIMALMSTRGYTAAVHKEGWRLLHAVSGYVEGAPPETIDTKVRDAIIELDRWDEDGFRLVRATLTRRFPAQAAFVLEGIGPSEGPAAVAGVKTLLERLDALEKSPNRKATRKQDQAALDTLAERGLDEKERARLANLVHLAESVNAPKPEGDGDGDGGKKKKEADHVEALVALRAWYEEWSEIARVAVKRRDYLILMGLARRRSPTKGAKAKVGKKAPKASDAGAKADGAGAKADGAGAGAG